MHFTFDDSRIGFQSGIRHRMDTAPNAADKESVLGAGYAKTNTNRMPILTKLLLHDENLPVDQHRAVQTAFRERLPYLSPENKIPPKTTVASLLAQKHEHLGENTVSYGRARMSKADSIIFERLQGELAAIEPKIATRQLYQLMHGHMDTAIVFSEGGFSLALPGLKTGNVVHVNTRMGILDPKTGALTTPALALGHEIEHVNVPVRYGRSMRKTKVADFTNAFETYVIDGYENAMHAAIGKGERTTHSSHAVLLHPETGRIVFPYTDGAGNAAFVQPGEKLQGTLIGADDHHLTLRKADGHVVKVETATALLNTFGLARAHELGFADPRSFVEKAIDALPTLSSTIRQSVSDAKKPVTDPWQTLKASFAKDADHVKKIPEIRRQIAKWTAGAGRGDALTISVNPQGLINMHRVERPVPTEPNPIQKMLSKAATTKSANTRNRWIAGASATAVAVALAIAIYQIAQNRKRKKAAKLQGTAA